MSDLLTGGISTLAGGLGDGLSPLLDVLPGLGTLLGVGSSLMGLFGGGNSQSQNQSQNQSQSQTAQGGNAYSSSGVYNSGNSQNTNTINFPNQSAGYALQGLLGAQTPANVMTAQGPQSIAPQLLSALPGFAGGAQASPASPFMPAISSSPRYSGGVSYDATPAPTTPASPQVASMSGGSFDPETAAAQAMKATMSPLSSQFLSMPGSQTPVMLASGGGGFSFPPNPYVQQIASDATGRVMPPTAPQGTMPSGSAPVPAPSATEVGTSQSAWKGIAEEPQMDFARSEPKRRGLTPADRQEAVPGAEAFQINGKLPKETIKSLQAAHAHYIGAEAKSLNEMVPTDQGLVPSSQAQEVLAGKIEKENKRIDDARGKLEKIYDDARKQFAALGAKTDLNGAPVGLEEEIANAEDQLLTAQKQHAYKQSINALEGWSPTKDPGLEGRIFLNQGLLTKLGSLIRPERLQWAREHALQAYSEAMSAYKEATPRIMEQQKMAAEAMMQSVDKDLEASKMDLMTDKSQLNSLRIRQNEAMGAERQAALKEMESALKTAGGQATLAEQYAYHDQEGRLGMLRLQEEKRYHDILTKALSEKTALDAVKQQLLLAQDQRNAVKQQRDEAFAAIHNQAENALIDARESEALKNRTAKSVIHATNPADKAELARQQGLLPAGALINGKPNMLLLQATYDRMLTNPAQTTASMRRYGLSPSTLQEIFSDTGAALH